MPEIHDRSNRSRFRKIIRIHADFTDVTDQNTRQETVADVRSNDLISHGDLIRRIGQFYKMDFPLIDQTQISGDNAVVGCGSDRGAHIAVVIDDGTYRSPVRPGFCHDSYKSSFGDDILIDQNPIIIPFVNREYTEPVSSIFRNDPGSDFFIFFILLIQLVQGTKPVQLFFIL